MNEQGMLEIDTVFLSFNLTKNKVKFILMLNILNTWFEKIEYSFYSTLISA